MGLKEKIRRKKIYFDTNIFIYLFEGNKTAIPQIKLLQPLIEQGEITVVSSALVYAEMLPPVVKNGNQKIIQSLIDFLKETKFFTLIPVSFDISIHAGVLRGETGMKTPDAIHVATAMKEKCDVFFTNDKQIKTPKSLERILFSDYQ